MINEVPKLQSLCLECGLDSQLSEVVARILDTLYAANCTQLEALPSTSEMSTSGTETLAVIDSHNGTLISPVSQNALRCLLIHMGRSNQITSLEESILKNFRGCGSDDYCLPDNKSPDWLTFIGEGASAIFQVPQITCYNLRTMVLCLLYWSSQENITCGHINNVLIINYTKATIQLYKGDSVTSVEEVDSESYISNLEAGDKVEIMVVCGYGLTLKKTAVYLIYGPSIQETIMKISHPDQDNFSLDIGGGQDPRRIPDTVESKSRRVNPKKLFRFFQKCFRK
ncbi:hypothetical protein QN277_010300 [Acacia crassicarpa]|uniref:Uncharacterized protein n=1 Tax=Acacia crassicarpa TaxID=499986 RepID=A0AAE1INJ0_9FABA|nr:hypothetical protein QN277_010300 [Acacia crassicarpa]